MFYGDEEHDAVCGMYITLQGLVSGWGTGIHTLI